MRQSLATARARAAGVGRPRLGLRSARGDSGRLEGKWICDVELIVVDQPSDGVEHRSLGLVRRGEAEQAPRFVDRGVQAS